MTIYTLTYNEQVMLPIFIEHYRSRFPNCEIVIFDNCSTDATEEIAYFFGCQVIKFDTNNQIVDAKYQYIKNNCWKEIVIHNNDWVIVADCDELLDITEKQLNKESEKGTTIIRAEAYNMVNHADNLDIHGIVHGVRSTSYDKAYCFNAEFIEEINYGMGAHHCVPIGLVQYSDKIYKAYHYKYINPDYMVERHKIFASRLSEENKLKGYGGHYLYTEEQIRNEFQEAKNKSIKIL